MLTQQFGMTAQVRSRRLEINRITDLDRQALRELQHVFAPHMAHIVNEFYAHIQQYPDVIAIIQSAGSSIEKLKQTNPRFFAECFRGEFDETYFESRLYIGKVHAQIGLSPQWFFAAMSTYYDVMFPILVKSYRLQAAKLTRALTALQKSLNLDQELIIEAYIEFGFISQLRKVVDEASSISSHLTSSTDMLRQSADESGRATTELARVCEQLAHASTIQAEAAQKAATSVNELADAGAQVSSGSGDQLSALNVVQGAMNEVKNLIASIDSQAAMWEGIRQRIAALDTVREAVSEASERVSQMNQRSAEIGRIVQTIDEISSQTNLLALNAAIEAARAGEHGRGFAVVAEEVRKLAESSSTATKEISALIRAVQEGSEAATESMNRTMTDFDDAAQVTMDAVGVLKEIVEYAGKASSKNSELTAAIDRVSEAARENNGLTTAMQTSVTSVNDAIENIAAITEENSASSEQVSASTEQMSAQVEELVASVHEVDGEVVKLANLITSAQAAIDKSSAGSDDRELQRAA